MSLEIIPNDVPDLLTWFNNFVGYQAVQNRISRVEHKLSNFGLLTPYYAKRFGFHLAYRKLNDRKRSGAKIYVVDAETRKAVSLIASLRSLKNNIADSQHEKLKARILDGMSPDQDMRHLEHELRVYVHYRRANCAVKWLDSEVDRYDFLILGPHGEFEVECKTFADHIGNPFSAEDSYVMFEAVQKALTSYALDRTGIITVEVEKRTSISLSDFETACSIFFNSQMQELTHDSVRIYFEPNEHWSEALAQGDRENLIRHYVSWQEQNNRHCMIIVSRRYALVICLLSRRRPRPLRAIFDSLKRASGQFSGTRPAVIWGHFLGFEGSDFKKMTARESGGSRMLDVFGNYLFQSDDRSHIARLRLSVDGGELRQERRGSHVIRYSTESGPAYDLTSKVCRFDARQTDEF